MKKMRTNSMENTHSKNRRHKNHSKQKPKYITDDVDEKESHIFNSVDKIRSGCLATTPVSSVGNIVDMQGLLDHGSVGKSEDGKNENKINSKKGDIKDSNESSKVADNQEMKKEERDDKHANNKGVKYETEMNKDNDVSNNIYATDNRGVSEAAVKNDR